MDIVALGGPFKHLLIVFLGCFADGRSFENFVTLATGWVLCTGRHTLTSFINLGLRRGEAKHHSALYRLLSRAQWDPDEMGRRLFDLLLRYLPKELEAPVDDTLCRRSGPHLFGGAMHYDAGRSSYGRFGRAAKKVLSFGHCWVTLAIWVPFPWNPERGLAVPVLWRLYRSKKRCKEGEFRKRTELAAEMVQVLILWLPKERVLYLLGDSEYACKTLVRALPKNVHFIGPLPKDAALYAPLGPYKGRGTKARKVGDRIAAPAEIIAFEDWQFTKRTLPLYGQRVTILFKQEKCLWYSVAAGRLGKMVVTRDPRGRWAERAYFCTNPSESAQKILMRFSHRWTLEQTYRDAKELLGIDEPQNGWWRRGRGESAPPVKPGPNPHPERGKHAVLRTVPLGFTTFGLTFVWYLQHGQPLLDVTRAQARSPWYLQKRSPAFGDMLRSARRALWEEKIHSDPRYEGGPEQLRELLLEQFQAA